jgi:hypothetical protein
MDPVTSYYGNLEYQQRQREFTHAAAQHALAQLVRDDSRNLWQRVNIRLPHVQISVTVVFPKPSAKALA